MKIVEALDKHQNKILEDPDLLKFRCVAGDVETEELRTYNELLDKWKGLMMGKEHPDSSRLVVTKDH